MVAIPNRPILLAAAVATAITGAAFVEDLALKTGPRAGRAAVLSQASPPAGTLIDHPCTNCALSVAATNDAVWAGTVNAGVVRWDRATGAMRRFTRVDGLGGDSVWHLAAEPSGRVWAAVRERTGHSVYVGLSLYDGGRWAHFPAATLAITELPTSMLADPSSGVWISGGGRTARFDGSAWQEVLAADGSSLSGYLASDGAGGLWLASGQTIYAQASGAWVARHSVAADVPDSIARALAVSADGTVYVALERGPMPFDALGIARHDSAGWHLFTVADGLAHDGVTALAVAGDGTVWAAHGTLASLSSFDGTRWRTHTTANSPSLPGDGSRALSVAPDGTLIVAGLSGGVGVRAAGGWTTLRDDTHPSGFIPFALAEAPDGAQWAGLFLSSGTHLVQRHAAERWQTWTIADGMIPLRLGAQLGALAIARDGTPWVGTWYDGVVTRDGVGWRKVTTADGLPSDEIHDVLVASDDRIWVATSAGIARSDGAGWSIFRTADGLPADRVLALAAEADGTIWAATSEGAARFDGTGWTVVTTADGLPSNSVTRIAVGPDGAVWFATYGGLARRDARGWRTWTVADGLPGDRFLFSLDVDASGRAWAGVQRADDVALGLIAVDDSGWQLLTEAEGLYIGGFAGAGTVFDVKVTRDGHVWIASLYGIQEFVPDALVPWPTPAPTTMPVPPSVPSCTCSTARRALPAAVLANALANPGDNAGWGERVNPNLPPSPANPLRACLDLQNPGTPFHALFNGPVWRGSCR